MPDIHVDDRVYQRMADLASQSGKPVSELAEEAMTQYLTKRPVSEKSLLDIKPFSSRGMRDVPLARHEIFEDMLQGSPAASGRTED